MSTESVRRPTAMVVALVVAVSVVVACSGSGPDRTTDPRPGLRADLHRDGFVLEWDAVPDVGSEGYELAVLSRSRVDDDWVDDGDWSVRTVSGTGTSHTDVVPGRRYLFRVRGADGEWSGIVERQFVEPTLPTVRLTTDDGDPILHDRATYRSGTFALDPDGADGVEPVPVRIRGRGNSTWRYVENKKSYQIKFGEPRALLDMPAGRRWVLLANAFDRSQLRTRAAFEIARTIGSGWVPSCTWVEVLLDGDYRGLYQLCEKIGDSPEKVDIDPLRADDTDPDTITGGYVLELGGTPAGSKTHWDTALTGRQVAIYRPSASRSNPVQAAYIRNHVDRVEEALFGDDFADPDGGFRAWLDEDALIDYWIVEELTLDDDAFVASVYVHKKRGDDKLYFGPVWDFDKSMGSDFSRYAPDTRGWLTMHPGMPDAAKRAWVVRAFEDSAFVARADRRWNELLPELRKVPDHLLEVAPGLDDAKANDLLRWSDEVDSKWEFRYGDERAADEPEAIADWLHGRMDWITDNLGDFDPHRNPGPMLPFMPMDP